ncbi:MAG: hypothetical protein JXQ27_13560 [Acidobacteria bacterium]|nr:hypothetical protein [Acidobacteriota bacterium]
MNQPADNSLLVIQGRTEVEGELLRNLLANNGIDTFHVPSLASAIMGRSTGFRFGVRCRDRTVAAEVLRETGLELEDYLAVPSAYNLDVPYYVHSTADPRRVSWRGVVTALFFIILGATLVLRFC